MSAATPTLFYGIASPPRAYRKDCIDQASNFQRSLFASGPLFLFVRDTNFDYNEINKFMKYYGIPKLDAITEDIIQMMPPVRKFFESNDNIDEFSKSLCAYAPLLVHKSRQDNFRAILREKINRLFSAAELKKIKVLDPAQGFAAGVVNHHGILNNPVLIGVDLTSRYSQLLARDKSGDILTFSTGNNPLGNVFHRRGFVIDGKKMTLYPKNNKNKIVYGHEKFDFQIVERLKNNKSWATLSNEDQTALEKIENTIHSINFNTCTSLGDQLTKINFHLWPLMFNSDLRGSLANLVSLEYDDCVSEYLIQILETEPDSYISKMVLDKNVRKRALAFFEGETGAWDEERGTGTQLFWGRSSENKRVTMKIVGGELCGVEEDFKIPLTLPELKKALAEKRIYSNMLIKFALLVFYSGIKPFAGYGSANYLSRMQNRLADFIASDYPEEAKLAKAIKVNNVTSVPVLLYRDAQGVIQNYFAFDIIKNGGLTRAYLESLKKVPVKYFMAPNLQTMYEYAFNLYGKGEKKDRQLIARDYAPLLDQVIA